MVVFTPNWLTDGFAGWLASWLTDLRESFTSLSFWLFVRISFLEFNVEHQNDFDVINLSLAVTRKP